MSDRSPRPFLSELKFWSFHCSLTALPSFLMAGVSLEYFKSPSSVAAMLLAVLVFIFGYTLLTTFLKPFQEKQNLISRALQAALQARLVVTLMTILVFILDIKEQTTLPYLPDYWAGFLSGMVINSVSGGELLEAKTVPFFLVFSWTILEGIILSFLLFMLTFFCLLVVTISQKRKWQKESFRQIPTSANDQTPPSLTEK